MADTFDVLTAMMKLLRSRGISEAMYKYKAPDSAPDTHIVFNTIGQNNDQLLARNLTNFNYRIKKGDGGTVDTKQLASAYKALKSIVTADGFYGALDGVEVLFFQIASEPFFFDEGDDWYVMNIRIQTVFNK